MQYETVKPSPLLQEYIYCIWTIKNNGSFSSKISIPPIGLIELTFCLHAPLTFTKSLKETSSNLLISGQRENPYLLSTNNATQILSIMLTPTGAATLLNIDTHEIKEGAYRGEDIFHDSHLLLEQLYESVNFLEQSTHICNYFEKKLKDSKKSKNKQLTYAVHQISTHGGNQSIDEIAYKCCYSKRQMERLFLQNIGISPKKFSNVIKFQKSLYLKQKNPSMTLSTLSLESGFSDQAHFSNMFKKYTGHSPRSYFEIYGAFSDYYSF